MLFEADLDVKTISSYVGHAQTSTTYDVYTDLRAQREAEKRAAILDIDIV